MPLSYDADVLGPCIEVFGEASQGFPVPVCRPIGGVPASFSLDGIFDRAYRLIDETTGLPVVSAQPRLGVRVSGFPAGVSPDQGDIWTIRGVDYAVSKVQLDGKGEAGLLFTVN